MDRHAARAAAPRSAPATMSRTTTSWPSSAKQAPGDEADVAGAEDRRSCSTPSAPSLLAAAAAAGPWRSRSSSRSRASRAACSRPSSVAAVLAQHDHVEVRAASSRSRTSRPSITRRKFGCARTGASSQSVSSMPQYSLAVGAERQAHGACGPSSIVYDADRRPRGRAASCARAPSGHRAGTGRLRARALRGRPRGAGSCATIGGWLRRRLVAGAGAIVPWNVCPTTTVEHRAVASAPDLSTRRSAPPRPSPKSFASCSRPAPAPAPLRRSRPRCGSSRSSARSPSRRSRLDDLVAALRRAAYAAFAADAGDAVAVQHDDRRLRRRGGAFGRSLRRARRRSPSRGASTSGLRSRATAAAMHDSGTVSSFRSW